MIGDIRLTSGPLTITTIFYRKSNIAYKGKAQLYNRYLSTSFAFAFFTLWSLSVKT